MVSAVPIGTPATPEPVSDAVTVTVVVPVRDAPATGTVIVAVGGMVSGEETPAARNATNCITHAPSPLFFSGAVAL